MSLTASANRMPLHLRPRRVEPSAPRVGIDVRPQDGFFPWLEAWGTRQNRVYVNPERDGGRRLYEPNGPYYLTLAPRLQFPVVEALMSRRLMKSGPWYSAAMLVQLSLDTTLGVFALIKIATLLACGRRHQASLLHFTQSAQILSFMAMLVTGGLASGVVYVVQKL